MQVAGGINFNKSTNRVMTLDKPPLLTNGKNGWYYACVFTPTTAGTLTIMESHARQMWLGKSAQLG